MLKLRFSRCGHSWNCGKTIYSIVNLPAISLNFPQDWLWVEFIHNHTGSTPFYTRIINSQFSKLVVIFFLFFNLSTFFVDAWFQELVFYYHTYVALKRGGQVFLWGVKTEPVQLLKNTYLPRGEGGEVKMGSSMGQGTARLFLARTITCLLRSRFRMKIRELAKLPGPGWPLSYTHTWIRIKFLWGWSKKPRWFILSLGVQEISSLSPGMKTDSIDF